MLKTIAVLVALYTWSHFNQVQERARRRQKRKMFRAHEVFKTIALLNRREVYPLLQYARFNHTLPLFQVYFNPERDLRRDFCMTRKSVDSLFLLMQQDKSYGWGHCFEILIFAHWLAHRLSYRVTAKESGVPKSSVCRIVHKIAGEIKAKLSKVIHVPQGDKLVDTGRGFGHLSQHSAFDLAFGAIAGWHIQIKPPKHCRANYFNYKEFYSIQMQAICDSAGQFLDIFVGYPGSVHNTSILQNSPIFSKSLYPPSGYFILGDGGYPCLEKPICLITPYKNSLSERIQENFNAYHIRAHSVAEETFRMLKARWRATFCKALEVKTSFCSDVIVACALLYNICLSNGDVWEPTLESNDGCPPPPLPPSDSPEPHETSGAQIRDRISAQLSATVNIPVPLMEHDYL